MDITRDYESLIPGSSPGQDAMTTEKQEAITLLYELEDRMPYFASMDNPNHVADFGIETYTKMKDIKHRAEQMPEGQERTDVMNILRMCAERIASEAFSIPATQIRKDWNNNAI